MRLTKIFCATFFMLIICYLPLVFAFCKPNCEINVPEDYPTIQDAINNASPFDVIYVDGGVYVERLFINKPIWICGNPENRPVIKIVEDFDIITVQASNVTISNLIVVNSGEVASMSTGVKLSNVSYCVISNNTIIGNFVGVLIEGSSSNLVQNNLIAMNRYGVFLRRFQRSVESFNNVIFRNDILNNSWNGIEIDWGGGNVIHANTISNNFAFGLEIPDYTPSYANVIFHNNFIDNAAAFGGIYQAYALLNNHWNFSGEGNYWSDFNGVDENSDAISDIPYKINYNAIDYFPLMGIFKTYPVYGHYVNIVSNANVTEFECGLVDGSGECALIEMKFSSEVEWFARISLPKLLNSSSCSLEVNGDMIECKNSTESDTYINLFVDYPAGIYVVKVKGLLVGEYSLAFILLTFCCVSTLLICGVKKSRKS